MRYRNSTEVALLCFVGALAKHQIVHTEVPSRWLDSNAHFAEHKVWLSQKIFSFEPHLRRP